MKWLILLAVLLAIVFVLGMRIGAGKQGASVAFTPVHELPETQRRAIDGALDNNQKILAIKHYRDVTGAGLAAARTAVEMHDRRRSQ
ncbi:MAG: hypothetical protein LCH60_05260 [Actinobacteria bacterium]|nr:hypothetical protein [Actinomycetota bacterium]